MKVVIDKDGFVVSDGTRPKGSKIVPKPPSTGMRYVGGAWTRPTPRHVVDGDGVYAGQIVSFDDLPSGLTEIEAGNSPPDGNHRLVEGTWVPMAPAAVSKLALLNVLPEDDWAKARQAMRNNPALEDRWIAATELRRDAPEIALIGQLLGYSEEQIDQAFISARS